MPDSSDHRIAVIAGATRGIGRALVDVLAERWGAAGTVYLTARRAEDGISATTALRAKGRNVDWLMFHLDDPQGAQRLADTLRSRHGGVDVAVLNAAFAPRDDVPAVTQARPMIEANNHGTLRFLNAFAPVMRENARLVVVASGFGVLASLSEKLRPRFDTGVRSASEIDRAMDDYVAAVEAGNAGAEGWPEWVNIPSKVGQVAVTRAFAREWRANGRRAAGVLINAACPGLTLTDATRDLMNTVFKGRAAQTVEEAANGLMTLLTLPAGAAEPDGELVRHGKVIPFGNQAVASDRKSPA